jgi:hypothetical protein
MLCCAVLTRGAATDACVLCERPARIGLESTQTSVQQLLRQLGGAPVAAMIGRRCREEAAMLSTWAGPTSHGRSRLHLEVASPWNSPKVVRQATLPRSIRHCALTAPVVS